MKKLIFLIVLSLLMTGMAWGRLPSIDDGKMDQGSAS
jgi:hypothetical protein